MCRSPLETSTSGKNPTEWAEIGRLSRQTALNHGVAVAFDAGSSSCHGARISARIAGPKADVLGDANMRDISRRDFIQNAGAGLLTLMPTLRSGQERVAESGRQGEDLCF